ncbi:MAG: hypothetical protein ACKVY0_21750 [Prosthecobacter sp.]|uniref:hypothetical protein n=1 Tax=Prosthecobacter sp. TaxID=1965333 RepID=UPI0039040C76
MTTFSQSGISGGGDLISAAINPANNNHIYIGCDMMGVYRTTNQGQSWSMLPTPTLACGPGFNVQFTYGSRGVVQYATKRNSWTSNATVPCISTDNGLSWAQMNLPANSSSGSIFGHLFADVTGSGGSTQRLVLEDYQKIWFTRTNGSSYSLAYSVTNMGGLRVAGVFWDGNSIYIGTNIGLLVSTDNGASWTLENLHPGMTDGQQIIEFCGAKNPTTGMISLFAVSVLNTVPIQTWTETRYILNSSYAGLYRMDYLGPKSSWVKKPIPSSVAVRHVDVSINDSRFPWCSAGRGINEQVFKSSDGGNTWVNTFKTQINPGVSIPNQNITTGFEGDGGIFSFLWGTTSSALDVADYNPRAVIVTGACPYLTLDGGATWRQACVSPTTQNLPGTAVPINKAYSSNGLNVTSGNCMFFLGAGEMMIGSADIGIQYSSDAGATWGFHRNLLTAYGTQRWPNCNRLARSATGTPLYAAVSDLHDMYETQTIDDATINKGTGDVLISSNNGISWTGVSSLKANGLPNGKFPGPVVWVATDNGNAARSTWVYACVANSFSTLGGIYLSKNKGLTWAKRANPPRTLGHPYNLTVLPSGQLVASYSATLSPQGVLSQSSGVFLSNDFGTTWLDRSSPQMKYFTKDVIVDPTAPSTWYASVYGAIANNTGNGGIYKTTNMGIAWTRVFADEYCQSVTVLSNTKRTIYATTDGHGLFVAPDGNAITPVFSNVPNFPFGRTKRVFADPSSSSNFWVTTMGGGQFKGTTK